MHIYNHIKLFRPIRYPQPLSSPPHHSLHPRHNPAHFFPVPTSSHHCARSTRQTGFLHQVIRRHRCSDACNSTKLYRRFVWLLLTENCHPLDFSSFTVFLCHFYQTRLLLISWHFNRSLVLTSDALCYVLFFFVLCVVFCVSYLIFCVLCVVFCVLCIDFYALYVVFLCYVFFVLCVVFSVVCVVFLSNVCVSFRSKKFIR